MVTEELIQRNYIQSGKIKGDPFGNFQCLELGSTTIKELKSIGLIESVPSKISFPFSIYKPPLNPLLAKPDTIYFRSVGDSIQIIANREMKKPSDFNTARKKTKAAEQALFSAAALSSPLAIISDGTQYFYIDVISSLRFKRIDYYDEKTSLNPGVLEWFANPKKGIEKNPNELSEKVWQAIWHATKEEPKQCLMTFVEIFILKFLSDNLSDKVLPKRYSFYELVKYDEASFRAHWGKSQIEYYVQDIRIHIKSIFKEKTVISDPLLTGLLGITTIVSPTSIINGFAFLQSSATSLETFNRTFLEILGYFKDFGELTNIAPEFKLRLYETFLKKTVRQQKLGQFFTPRNIVRSMVQMAQLQKLGKDSIVLDPAAGVGGFILEPLILENALKGNIKFVSGKPIFKVRLMGMDCDANTNILAKANMLIHLAEFLRDPSVSLDGLNILMAQTFLLLNTNQHLGTLEYPLHEKIDIILTNPPYVTQGSKIYKEEIGNIKGSRNGIDLHDYYDKCGLGLESLFLRYISGALKPGGKAFVIVPKGLLTRTDPSAKSKLLSECNILASISLPRSAFYSTPQKTYIIAIEKRRTEKDVRPKVFCAISTSVGESLDARRISLADDNNLSEIAAAFVCFQNGQTISESITKNIRIVDPSEFSADDRWDVYSFWDDGELVDLGEREEAITRISFIEEVTLGISELVSEMTVLSKEINDLSQGLIRKVSISDTTCFDIRPGKRVTRKDGDINNGEIPVYSGSKDPLRPLCRVNESWAEYNGIPIESKPIVTVNANGYVGAVFYRNEKCIIHDDVMIVDVKDDKILMDFLVYALRSSIAEGNFEYEAKLYSRVKELDVNIPVKLDGSFDLETQTKIASAYKKFDSMKKELADLGSWATKSRLKD